MSFVVKVAKTLRNNWKKTAFAVVALNYGYDYSKEHLETQELMRKYCTIAAQYGRQTLAPDENPQQITVILNPNANKRKAAKEFERYCAPILNVAGICVDIVQTENEGHAKELMEQFAGSDAVVVAGGDGTLSEVLTGLFRRQNGADAITLPLGVLPLGKSNTIAKRLFPGGSHLAKVKSLADAALAVVESKTRPIDVLKVVTMDEDAAGKPIYAVCGIEWGAYREAECKKETYWYYGPLRKYVTYVFNGLRNSLNSNCEAVLFYTTPCDGCTNCQKAPQRRWYQRLFAHTPAHTLDNTSTTTDQCRQVHEETVSTADFALYTSNVLDEASGPPKLQIRLGPDALNYVDFVSDGWRTERGRARRVDHVIDAKEVELKPVLRTEEEKWFSIDKEEFEVKPIKVTLLPRAVNMFCKKTNVAI